MEQYPSRPMITITEAEKSVLTNGMELRGHSQRTEAALLDSARNMSQGVLSAWSYEDFQNETPNGQITLTRPESVPVAPNMSLEDTSSPLESPEQQPSTRSRSISKASTSKASRPQDSASLKRHRGRPDLGLSPTASREVSCYLNDKSSSD
jgi:hypothetical protein